MKSILNPDLRTSQPIAGFAGFATLVPMAFASVFGLASFRVAHATFSPPHTPISVPSLEVADPVSGATVDRFLRRVELASAASKLGANRTALQDLIPNAIALRHVHTVPFQAGHRFLAPEDTANLHSALRTSDAFPNALDHSNAVLVSLGFSDPSDNPFRDDAFARARAKNLEEATQDYLSRNGLHAPLVSWQVGGTELLTRESDLAEVSHNHAAELWLVVLPEATLTELGSDERLSLAEAARTRTGERDQTIPALSPDPMLASNAPAPRLSHLERQILLGAWRNQIR